MTTFWKLFRESYIIQGTIALAMVLTIIYLMIAGRDVPEALINFTALILGFYFGSKTGNRAE